MVASAIRGTRYFVELLISATIPNVNIVIFLLQHSTDGDIYHRAAQKKARQIEQNNIFRIFALVL